MGKPFYVNIMYWWDGRHLYSSIKCPFLNLFFRTSLDCKSITSFCKFWMRWIFVGSYFQRTCIKFRKTSMELLAMCVSELRGIKVTIKQCSFWQISVCFAQASDVLIFPHTLYFFKESSTGQMGLTLETRGLKQRI